MVTLEFFDRERKHLSEQLKKITGQESATRIALSKVSASNGGSSVGAAAAAAGSAAAVSGAAAAVLGGGLLPGALLGFAPTAAVAGPPGWIVFGVAALAALIVGGIVLDRPRLAASTDAHANNEATRTHVEEQLKQLGEARVLFDSFWFQFEQRRHEEIQKIYMAGFFLLFLIAYSFLAPYAADHFGRHQVHESTISVLESTFA